MMRFALKPIIIASLFQLFSISPAVAAGDLGAILSKPGTRTLFGLSRTQWEANVSAIVASRVGEATGSSKTGIGLSINTPDGVVETLPVYIDGDAKPNSLQVTVRFGRQQASLLSDAAVWDAIEQAQQEMLPEYKVTGKFNRVQDGLVILFNILEARPVAQNSLGAKIQFDFFLTRKQYHYDIRFSDIEARSNVSTEELRAILVASVFARVLVAHEEARQLLLGRGLINAQP